LLLRGAGTGPCRSEIGRKGREIVFHPVVVTHVAAAGVTVAGQQSVETVFVARFEIMAFAPGRRRLAPRPSFVSVERSAATMPAWDRTA
jgi:hypothetical protein